MALPDHVACLATRRIVVCADDFAVHASASHGIAQLAQLGRLSATSAMVLSPLWPQHAALLAGVRGQIDVGLHLDWTSSFAVQAGHGMPLGVAMRRAMLGGFDLQQATRVIEQQLDAFETHWGAAPDHIDGHQHVQQFAGIAAALVQVLRRRYAGQPVQPYLRISRPAAGLQDLKSRVIALMGANALENIAASAGITCARALFGIYNFQGGRHRYAGLMQHWLKHAPEAGVLMCHPAQSAEPADEIGAARATEGAYLAGSVFAAALAQAHIQLVRGRQVLAGSTEGV